MIKVGFITSASASVFRGMDAYAKYLLPPMQKLCSEYQLSVEPVTLDQGIKSSQFDLYHFPVFSLYQPIVPLNFKSPFVVTVHDVTRLEFPGRYPPGLAGRLRLQYQKLVLHRARLIITDSYSSVRQIRTYLGIGHPKIRMVYLASDKIFHPVKNSAIPDRIAKKYRLPKKFILTNGDIDWNKNLTSLARVCNNLRVHLVVYGKSPRQLLDQPGSFNFRHAELSHLEGLRQELTGKYIHVLGFVPDPDLVYIFNQASLYCQPSFAEGFGIPVLQALSCGIPVACSRTHSLPEIAGGAAVYFDPADVTSISEAIIAGLNDTKLRTRLISDGFIQSGKFSWDHTARLTLQVYREALQL